MRCLGLLLALVVGLSTAFPLLAATLSVHMPESVPPGSPFTIDFIFDSEGEVINTLAAKITLPEGLVGESISYGNSFLQFWMTAPKLTDRLVEFAGIAPGGFSGSSGIALSITATAVNEGLLTLDRADTALYLNDGLGTQIPLTFKGASVNIKPGVELSTGVAPDLDPPEVFTPIVSNSPDLYGGRWFLVFATQDKGSGVAFYQVCEGRSRCARATSPYALRHQALDRPVTIKAFDLAGNVQTVELPATHERSLISRTWLAILALGLLLLITGVLIFNRLANKHRG